VDGVPGGGEVDGGGSADARVRTGDDDDGHGAESGTTDLPSFAVLDDGTYDALVFDADEADGGGVAVELTILAGAHKGAVVSVVSHDWEGDALDLLGIPATLVVTEGRPQVTFEP
jgi:hypothetical protein